MREDFSLTVVAENGFSVLNRIINILNRRRVRIKKASMWEDEKDARRGEAVFVLHTSEDVMKKAQLQIDKLIEVAYTKVERL